MTRQKAAFRIQHSAVDEQVNIGIPRFARHEKTGGDGLRDLRRRGDASSDGILHCARDGWRGRQHPEYECTRGSCRRDAGGTVERVL